MFSCFFRIRQVVVGFVRDQSLKFHVVVNFCIFSIENSSYILMSTLYYCCRWTTLKPLINTWLCVSYLCFVRCWNMLLFFFLIEENGSLKRRRVRYKSACYMLQSSFDLLQISHEEGLKPWLPFDYQCSTDETIRLGTGAATKALKLTNFGGEQRKRGGILSVRTFLSIRRLL